MCDAAAGGVFVVENVLQRVGAAACEGEGCAEAGKAPAKAPATSAPSRRGASLSLNTDTSGETQPPSEAVAEGAGAGPWTAAAIQGERRRSRTVSSTPVRLVSSSAATDLRLEPVVLGGRGGGAGEAKERGASASPNVDDLRRHLLELHRELDRLGRCFICGEMGWVRRSACCRVARHVECELAWTRANRGRWTLVCQCDPSPGTAQARDAHSRGTSVTEGAALEAMERGEDGDEGREKGVSRESEDGAGAVVPKYARLEKSAQYVRVPEMRDDGEMVEFVHRMRGRLFQVLPCSLCRQPWQLVPAEGDFRPLLPSELALMATVRQLENFAAMRGLQEMVTPGDRAGSDGGGGGTTTAPPRRGGGENSGTVLAASSSSSSRTTTSSPSAFANPLAGGVSGTQAATCSGRWWSFWCGFVMQERLGCSTCEESLAFFVRTFTFAVVPAEIIAILALIAAVPRAVANVQLLVTVVVVVAVCIFLGAVAWRICIIQRLSEEAAREEALEEEGGFWSPGTSAPLTETVARRRARLDRVIRRNDEFMREIMWGVTTSAPASRATPSDAQNPHHALHGQHPTLHAHAAVRNAHRAPPLSV